MQDSHAEIPCKELLAIMVERGGTDLLLSVGQAPQIRVDKTLRSLDYDHLTPEKSKELCYQVMNEDQQKTLEDKGEVDFSFGLHDISRFRANVFMQRGSVSGAFRRIPYTILTFEELSLPPVVKETSDRPNGLVLVTGPTGCGKSTTLAAMLERINETRYCHIITIEDPIEYLHKHKKATVDQREVHSDTKSFHSALRSILRQDPDVVLLGEMRDAESIQAAITVAETGHLCFATLHTNSCSQTLARIVDVFPGEKQPQIRTQLALSLNCVMTQVLLPKIGGGLQLALEIMVATPAIRALIRENKLHNIDNQIRLGSKFGMQSMNQSLSTVVKSGLVAEEDAMDASLDKDDFRKCMIELPTA
jgi:twitching motility protein PilT